MNFASLADGQTSDCASSGSGRLDGTEELVEQVLGDNEIMEAEFHRTERPTLRVPSPRQSVLLTGVPGERKQSETESTRRWEFGTTHWSAVLSAGRTDTAQSSEALEKLCGTYWPPIYSYIRRLGHGPEEAQDFTQAFFAKLLERNFWARADPQKGRFRSFLLTALRHFLADERDRAKAAKRGGGVSFISFDEQASEERFLEGARQNLSSEQQFDRQWAATVLEQARAKLRQECAASGKLDLLDRVSLIDGHSQGSVPYAIIAEELGMSISAIKSAVFRLRERYGELVREEVAHTVSSPAEIDAEIRHLLSVISA